MKTVMGVAIIFGWVLALVWLLTSVTQIAVDRIVMAPCITSTEVVAC